MKTYTISFVLLTICAIPVSCGVFSKGGNRKNAAKITGTMLVEKPVCDNSTTPPFTDVLGNATYYVKRGTMNHPDSIAFDEFSTNADGKFTLFLQPGDYAIVHKDKLMNFGEFRLKYSSDKSTYYKVRDEDCFKRWYNAADFLLHVDTDTTVQFLVKSRCFIQTNPCIEYVGPK